MNPGSKFFRKTFQIGKQTKRAEAKSFQTQSFRAWGHGSARLVFLMFGLAFIRSTPRSLPMAGPITLLLISTTPIPNCGLNWSFMCFLVLLFRRGKAKVVPCVSGVVQRSRATNPWPRAAFETRPVLLKRAPPPAPRSLSGFHAYRDGVEAGTIETTLSQPLTP